jgi:hypothetical protein
MKKVKREQVVQKIDVVKHHFIENRKVYIAIGVTTVVAVAGTYFSMKSHEVKVVQKASQNALVNWKPTIHQEQYVTVELPARGHRGFAILNDDTCEVYGSIKKAATDIGCSQKTLRDHLKGLIDNIDGNTYTNLGENLSEQVKVSV